MARFIESRSAIKQGGRQGRVSLEATALVDDAIAIDAKNENSELHWHFTGTLEVIKETPRIVSTPDY